MSAHGQTIRYVGARQIVVDGNPTPVPFWVPDRSFAGEIVTIIGGGPSLATLDLDVLAGHRFIAVNSSCRKVRPIATAGDILYFSDNSWNENRPALAANWQGPVVTSNRNAKARLGDAVRRLDISALTETMRCMPDFVQASSGHSAACLAAIMGARRIVLVGFEGQTVGGRSHGHDDYAQHDLAAFVERYLPAWRVLAPALARMGAEVVNATPGSAIAEFPFVPLAEALR